MKETVAVYAGTFDPVTQGHRWVVEEGARLFSRLIVAIGLNPLKKCLFSPEDRLAMLTESLKDIPNVTTDVFPWQFLVNYARKAGASHIIRGIRSVGDYELEREMRDLNGGYAPDITTVFFIPPSNLATVRSSTVKGLVGPEGWEDFVRPFVSEPVFKKLKEAHDAGSK